MLFPKLSRNKKPYYVIHDSVTLNNPKLSNADASGVDLVDDRCVPMRWTSFNLCAAAFWIAL